MSENVAQTVQKAIQDLVAPDLRELKVTVGSNQKQTELRFDEVDTKFTGLQKQIDQRFDDVDTKFTGFQKQIDQRFDDVKATVTSNQKRNDLQFANMQKQMDHRFDAQDAKAEFMFKSLMSAIAGVKAQNNLATLQAISALSERVAILESRHQ